MRKILKIIILFLINHFLCGNRLWKTKCFLLKFAGIKIGKNVKVVGPIKIDTCLTLTIGDECWIGRNFQVIGNDNVKIGNNCDIAPDVIFETGTHLIGSTNRRAGEGYCMPINIGDGSWIGVRATILPGVHIENGCVIAAGAVVTKSISKNCLVGGVPAKILKKLTEEGR